MLVISAINIYIYIAIFLLSNYLSIFLSITDQQNCGIRLSAGPSPLVCERGRSCPCSICCSGPTSLFPFLPGGKGSFFFLWGGLGLSAMTPGLIRTTASTPLVLYTCSHFLHLFILHLDRGPFTMLYNSVVYITLFPHFRYDNDIVPGGKGSVLQQPKRQIKRGKMEYQIQYCSHLDPKWLTGIYLGMHIRFSRTKFQPFKIPFPV